MTLDATQRARLLTSGVRGCRVRLWLFDALPTVTAEAAPENYVTNTVGGSLATLLRPMALISPPYSLLLPGESVPLYGGDSFERGGDPAGGHTWTLIDGSATLQPQGDTCVVTPTVPDEVVTVRLAVTASNGNVAYRYAYVVASVDGWTPPVGVIQASGDYAAEGWSGTMTILGDANSAADLEQDKLLLIHVETTYDGELATMGGYKRAENLALLRIVDWDYREDGNRGRGETVVQLGAPDEYLARYDFYMRAVGYEMDNERGVGFTQYADTETLYISDLRITDAILAIAGLRGLNENANFTVFHDSNTFTTGGEFWLPSANIREQIRSAALSAGGIYFCNFTGSVQCIPSPSVRADEWWGTPSPIFDAANPLTEDYLLDYEIIYRRQDYDQVVVAGFDEFLRDTSVSATSATATFPLGDDRVLRVSGGYIKPTQQAADDMLAFANRDWDAVLTLACPGNTLNVGDFLYVDLEPRQAGHDAAQGLAYVSEVQHNFDMDRHMQVTRVHIAQITNWTG